ncbi:MAG: hypothetical protein ACP5IO_05445 [Elusimicrobiales bacterium]
MRSKIFIYLLIVSFLCVRRNYCFVSSSSDYELLNSNIPNSSSISQGNSFFTEGCLGQNIATDNVRKSSDYVVRNGFYNPAHFQFQKKLPGVYQWSDERSVVFAQDSVDLDRFDIFWREKDITDGDDVAQATRKISMIKGVEIPSVESFEFACFNEEDFTTKFAKPAKLRIKVSDTDGDGYVDGSNKVKLKTLEGYIYDSEYKLWAKAFSSRVSYYGTVAFVDFETLSGGLFAIMGDIDTSVKDVYAFPVPFRPNGPKAGKCPGCTGTDEDGIVFYNIPQKGYIEIYTVDGRIVKKLIIDNPPDSKIKWDTKNEEGEKAASGVYIWRVVSESYMPGYKNTKTGKLVIIR